MKIEVQHKANYGKDIFYPLSDDAKFLSKVIGKKGFVLRHLSLFKEHGWNVVITVIPKTLDDYLKAS